MAGGLLAFLRWSMEKALVLLSGGLDSTIALFWARKRFGDENVRAVTYDYGQANVEEMDAAEAVAALAGISLIRREINPLDARGPVMTTFQSWADVHADVSLHSPGRILELLVRATAETSNDELNIVSGVSAEHHYPDYQPHSIAAATQALKACFNKPLTVHVPCLYLTKEAVIRFAGTLTGCMEALGVTMSCDFGKRPPCGVCRGCWIRAHGFELVGIPDPMLE